MDRAQLRIEIAEIIELQEAAINSHPPEIAAIYVKGRDAAMVAARSPSPEIVASYRAKGITDDEFALMLHHILSASFISAWYHLHGERANRDKIAHSCCTLIDGIDTDSGMSMKVFLRREQIWREQLGQGTGKRASCMASGALMVVIVTVLLWLALSIF